MQKASKSRAKPKLPADVAKIKKTANNKPPVVLIKITAGPLI